MKRLSLSQKVVSSLFLVFPFVAGFIVASCQNTTSLDSHLHKKYSFHLMLKDGTESLMQTDSLASGKFDPVQKYKTIPHRNFYGLIARNGYYYYLDSKNASYVKCKLTNTSFEKVGFVPLKGFSIIENLTWLSADSLLLIGYDGRGGKTRYARVDVNTMTAEQGLVDIPSPFGSYNWISVGFTKVEAHRLLIGYTYHSASKPGEYTTSDTIYIDELAYPSMKSVSRFKDTRSIYPGGLSTKESYSFTDEHGDFYFVACPGIIGGNNPLKPTAIFKIPKGETKPDTNYFFNISASPIGNHGYGFWYIGNGKAIIRTERKALYTGIKDHYKVPHFDFYLLNLQSQTAIRLDLPLDKGSARQCVLVEKGRVYITVNSDTEGCYVWVLNPETLQLKKGLQFIGETDYILRMEAM